MKIFERYNGDVVILDVIGNLDFDSAPELKVKLEALIKFGHQKIVLNLSAVDLIDSTGVGSIMFGLKLIDPTVGDIKIVGLSFQNKNIISVLELDKVFSLMPSEEQAIGSFFDDGATMH